MAAVGLALAGLGARAAPATEPARRVIDVRAASAVDTFEAHFAELRRAEQAGEPDKAAGALREIRRLRVERHVRQLELVALPLVGQGLEQLAAGEVGRAEETFRQAIALAPALPDGHFGLARALEARGILGRVRALTTRVRALTSLPDGWRGRDAIILLCLPAGLMLIQALAVVVAAALAFRHGGLLRHDLEETLGASRLRGFSLGLTAVLLLAPALAFQGWGFLPLWCLALLYPYLNLRERCVAGSLVALTLSFGPATWLLEREARVQRDPLRAAALVAVEAGPDQVALATLERAHEAQPQDRDLSYLLARLYRKAGLSVEATSVYRELLGEKPEDPVALVSLANIEFADNAYAAAIARYGRVAQGGAAPAVAAVARYNQSLAYLQVFDRQRSEEARVDAERLGQALVSELESRWVSDGLYGVVEVGPRVEDVAAKFDGGLGPPRVNVFGVAAAGWWSGLPAAAWLGRFTAWAAALGVLVGIVRWRRGARMFTLRCLKCGTPFCRRCHLGKVVGGLCTQCYHLFVVRDGVSGPARNQKLLEVQAEEGRRERIFRGLTLASPGAGHVYAQRPWLGIGLSAAWYGLLIMGLLAGRVVPLTLAPHALVGGTHALAIGAGLLAIYVVANVLGPGFESARLGRRARRARV